ncbi:MAG: lipoyl synthase [Deltaproteobacteria bacterium]|nr:lipoyl synthase [Deltaproteobacteria bacterium]
MDGRGCSERLLMRLPDWLKRSKDLKALRGLKLKLRHGGLSTVCEEARCPNIAECFCRPTATFLLLGDVCTRSCRFCAVHKGTPSPLDVEEPSLVAKAARDIGLTHVVLTSVTRDDLPDKGARGFASALSEIGKLLPGATREVLTPDFAGRRDLLETVLEERPDVLGHNVETVERLYESIRPGASLKRSLSLLRLARDISRDVIVKSGFMVGLGESEKEIKDLLLELRDAGCDCVTIGQYLQPTRAQIPVSAYWEPRRFEAWSELAKSTGIRYVVAGPLVRSSYHSKEVLEEIRASLDAPTSACTKE